MYTLRLPCVGCDQQITQEIAFDLHEVFLIQLDQPTVRFRKSAFPATSREFEYSHNAFVNFTGGVRVYAVTQHILNACRRDRELTGYKKAPVPIYPRPRDNLNAFAGSLVVWFLLYEFVPTVLPTENTR